MNNIPQKQNEDIQLQRLAAQREIYSSAKKYHSFQILTTALIPVVLSILSLFIRCLSITSAIYGLFIFLIDIWYIDPTIKKKKTKAAKIQELFDCDVLSMDKSPLKTVDDVTVEEILIHYNAHSKIKHNIEKIRDWYSPEVGKLPLYIARILCQRANCRWDSSLREKYSFILKITSVVIIFCIVLIGLILKIKLVEFILIISALVPFFRFCIFQSNLNNDSSEKLSRLVSYTESIWKNAINNNLNESELVIEARRIQDELFEHRKNAALILDFFYKFHREENELLMNKGAEILVKEAEEKLK